MGARHTCFFHLRRRGLAREVANSSLRLKTHASLCGSGMLASTFLISAAPKPVAVRLCLGREIPSGPMGPWISVMGALADGFLSRVWVAMVDVQEEIELLRKRKEM